ncbi:MAG: DUF2508 family protein [Clostridiales bacterium]|nr:DUF2508 family protein [Clostridiales bacterium]
MKENEKKLMQSILQANNDLKVANANFENAEAEMIDYYTYQIKANKAKIDYLIKKVKEEGTNLNMIEQLELKNNITEAI